MLHSDHSQLTSPFNKYPLFLFSFFVAIIQFSCFEVKGSDNYYARETGNHIEVFTPDGKKKLLFGNFALPGARHFRLSVPLESISDSLLPVEPEKKEAVTPEPPKEEPEIKEIVVEKPPPPPQDEKKIVLEYDDSDRLVVEANWLFNQGRYYEATVYVEELLRKNPEYARAWAMKGSLMYVQGHKDLAKKSWQQALELEPKNKEVENFLKRVQ